MIRSLSDHYNSPGRLAEYKRQLQRVARRPGDNPSMFAIKLKTIQLQMVRDRFIHGQADCALRRHLESLGPNTPMIEMVDSCRIWERHCEPEIQPRTSVDRHPVRMTCQVTEDETTPAVSPETESVEDMIKRLLPTPAPPLLQAAPTHSDRDLLIQQLMETICPPTPVAQERSSASDLETLLLNWLPVGTVTEEDIVSPEPLSDSVEGCFRADNGPILQSNSGL